MSDEELTVANSENNRSYDYSNSDESSDKDFHNGFELSEITSIETEPVDELNNSDEFHDVEYEDSDESFVSSLEQMIGNDSDAFTDNDETLKAEITNGNCSISVEENNEQEIDNAINEFDMEKEVDSAGAQTDTNLRVNSTKITFYCESVNKLMSDSGGDECEEIIQEMTTPRCVTVDLI